MTAQTLFRAQGEVSERATTRLRRLLDAGLVVAAGCYDPLTARLAEIAGFQAVHLTGLGVAISQLGVPDLGLTTLTELADAAFTRENGMLRPNLKLDRKAIAAKYGC